MSKILYISYDGVMEPIGQSQVLAYLLRLSAQHTITLLSYEKPTDLKDKDKRQKIAAQLKQANIRWTPLRYHRKPAAPATAYDLLRGVYVAAFLCWHHRIDIVHVRSYVPAVIALFLKKYLKRRFIFDIRGFWIEEKVEAGAWSEHSAVYRLAKWLERRFYDMSDEVVSLTHAALPYIRSEFDCTACTVISTCTNLEKFSLAKKQDSAVITLGYVGNVRGLYQFDATVAFCRAFKAICPNMRLLILNQGEHDYIKEKLLAGGVALEDVMLVHASHEEVPHYIQQMDASVFFIKPSFSKIASAPTKLGELLGCGVPCVSNRGIGDMAHILENNGVGIAVSDFETPTLEQAAEALLALLKIPNIQAECRQVAEQYFTLYDGIDAYNTLYTTLSEAHSA